MPSWGFVMAARTAKTVARSGRSRHSSRTPRSMNTTPTESTWPQMTLSNQVIGLKTTNAAATRPALELPPSSRTIDQAR